MGRKKKYLTEEEKIKARKERQMKYYNENKKKFDMMSLKEMKEYAGNSQVEFPDDWLELVLEDIEIRIKSAARDEKDHIYWVCGFVKCVNDCIDHRTFYLDTDKIQKVIKILKSKGYSVEMSFEKNYKISGW